MQFKKITINNYRCFEKYEVSFADETTIIIGKNGTGKTNLITALKKGLSFIFSRKKVGTQNFVATSNGLHIARFELFDARFDLLKRDFEYPIKIDYAANFDSEEIEWHFTKATANGSIAHSGYEDALSRFLNYYGINDNKLPVLAFFSDSYPHVKANISEQTNKILNGEVPIPRSFGYYKWDEDTNCAEIWQRRFIKVYNDVNDYKQTSTAISDEVNYLEKRLKQTDEADQAKRASWQSRINELQDKLSSEEFVTTPRISIDEINFIEDCIKTFTAPLREEFDFINSEFQVKGIYVSRPKGGDFNIQFSFADGRLMFFDSLPQGYKRLFSIVLDIAYRGIVLNGPVEPEGIVFVDEIELHLHPALQQEVLARLRKTFPKIQFIVSTHSPLVITNVIADGNKVKIVRLELDGGLYTNSTLGNINGIDYNTGLTDIMGVLYRPSEIDNLIDSYVILKLRNKETEARMVWDEIFAIVGRDNQRIVTEIDSKLQQNR